MKEINFIGIGAQKSGTSWLYHRLTELSDFSLPYIKELHYFDRDPKYPSPIKLSKSKLRHRIFNIQLINNAFLEIASSIYRLDYKRLKWMCKWHLSTYNNNWYISLFNNFEGIRGEITPAYAILQEEDIKKMHMLAPKAKIIFIIRNPIERAWSHFRYNLTLTKKENYDITDQDIIKFIENESQISRSDYLRTLELYSKIFPKENICVAFYDSIIENPAELLNGIVNFLGGDVTKIKLECNLYSKTNVSEERELPQIINHYLTKKYSPLIERLSAIFGGYSKIWDYNLKNINSSEENCYSLITLDKLDFYK